MVKKFAAARLTQRILSVQAGAKDNLTHPIDWPIQNADFIINYRGERQSGFQPPLHILGEYSATSKVWAKLKTTPYHHFPYYIQFANYL